MIEKLLNAAGLPCWAGWTNSPPEGTYALYLDDVTAEGPDNRSGYRRHDVTVEVYEPAADPNAEAALEAVLDEAGLHWTRQARYWLKDVQLYQTIYGFTYFEKWRT